MAREDGELGLYSILILPQAFGMARESSELGLTIFTILPHAFGMARENSKIGVEPGPLQIYRTGEEQCRTGDLQNQPVLVSYRTGDPLMPSGSPSSRRGYLQIRFALDSVLALQETLSRTVLRLCRPV